MPAAFRFFPSLFLLALASVGCASAATSTSLAPPSPAIRLRPPAAVAQPVHREITGEPAAAIFRALGAVLERSNPSAIEVEELDCRHLPFDHGVACSLRLPAANGPPADVQLRDEKNGPKRCATLIDALLAGGAGLQLDKVSRVTMRRLVARVDRVAFDDRANVARPIPTNVDLTGEKASRVFDALALTGVTEDDGGLFILCTRFDGVPTCSWRKNTMTPANTLDARASAAVWDAFLAAGQATQPLPTDRPDATLGDVTIVNAYAFSYDGTHLRSVLVLGTARPPGSLPQ